MQGSFSSISIVMTIVFFLAYSFLPLLGGLGSGFFIAIGRRRTASYLLSISIAAGYLTAKNAITSSVLREPNVAFLVFGSILPCLVTITLLLIRSLGIRLSRAIRWIVKALILDASAGITCLRERIGFKETSVTSCPTRDTLKLPWRWIIRFTLLIGFFVIGNHAKRILDTLQGIAPRMNFITNTMDLVSLVLITPKSFSGSSRETLQELFYEVASKTFGNRSAAWDIQHVLAAGAILIIALFPFLWVALAVSSDIGPKVIKMMNSIRLIYRAEGLNFDWIDQMGKPFVGWILILDRLRTFVDATAIISTAMTASLAIGAGFRKLNRVQQEKWEDRLLWLSIVIFAYSRALSML